MIHHDSISAQSENCSGRHCSVRHDNRDFVVGRPQNRHHSLYNFDDSPRSVENHGNRVLFARKHFY